MASRPSLRMVLRMASTWPWGRVCWVRNRSWGESFVAQQAAQGFDFVWGPVGEVGQSALAGFAAFAPAFAEEDGGGRVAIGDGMPVPSCCVGVRNCSDQPIPAAFDEG